VQLGGIEVSGLPERDRCRLRREHVGFVFQSDNLLPYLTAIENVQLSLALSPSQLVADQGMALLTDLGLAEHAAKLPDQLSGGQRLRVAIARATIHRPAILLADEPTGSLDVHTATVILDVLLRAQRATGATLVLVTHDPDVARRLDRTVLLIAGRLSSGRLGSDRLSSGRLGSGRLPAPDARPLEA
jgi:predicted ABC-type transport system involved in lysophospholipase L1 biosynthesis ATPase subunit